MFASALIIIIMIIITTAIIIIIFEGRLKLILITDFVSVVRLWDLTSDFHRGANWICWNLHDFTAYEAANCSFSCPLSARQTENKIKMFAVLSTNYFSFLRRNHNAACSEDEG